MSGNKKSSVFSKNEHVQELVRISGELADIGNAAGLLSWDQETYMPVKGAEARAKQLATLAGIYHEKLTSLTVKQLINQVKKLKKLNIYSAALLREIGRVYRKENRLPKKLVEELSEVTSRAFDVWQKAKKESNFALFEKDLARVVRLNITAAKLLREKGQTVYDAMLDDYEHGLTEKEAERVFREVQPKLTALAKKLSKITAGADSKIANKGYKWEKQWGLGMRIIKDMGYDLEAGRQDTSAHPFTTGFGTGDVRITTWKNESDLRPALFATIHETGHALYEQGIDPRLERAILGGGTGLAMHESQSRMWENMVGRSEWFWKKYYPQAQQAFQALQAVSRQEFVKAINVVRPSLIRVEADEVTYGLHIIIRFEIEKDLVRGKIKIKDLPKIWNQKYKELLGVTPKNDREGVLQDVHWSHGLFGYFPTYLLGTMMAAQIFATAQKQIDVTNLKALREWLRVNIHQYGKVYSSSELLKRVTGERLNPQHYIDYLEEKFAKLYNPQVMNSKVTMMMTSV